MRLTQVALVLAVDPKGGYGTGSALDTVNDYDVARKVAEVLEEYEAAFDTPQVFHVLYFEGKDIDPETLYQQDMTHDEV